VDARQRDVLKTGGTLLALASCGGDRQARQGWKAHRPGDHLRL